ncbi:MAG: ribosome-associated translation inhibitor RaiA [Acidimicrobiales bacterium]
MEIAIRSRNLEVTDSLRSVVEHKVGKLTRFLEGMDRAEVRFTEEKNPRIADCEVCEVTVHGHGHVVRARAAAHDPMAAVDKVIDKLEHQLVKLKTKLVGRSHARHAGHHNNGLASEEPAGPPRHVRPAPGDLALEDLGEAQNGGRIVRSKRFSITPMTPDDAAVHMDLLGHNFYFFTNSESDRPAVVYRRHDGHVGLIDAT